MIKTENSNFVYSKELEAKIWEDCVIVFDTSALLELYLFSDTALTDIYENIFKAYDKKLWIPAQVEYEYLKHREAKMKAPVNVYKDLKEKTDSKNNDSGYLQSLKSTLSQYSSIYKNLYEKTKKANRHPFLDESLFNNFSKKIELFNQENDKFYDAINENIKIFIKKIEEKIANNDDYIWEKLNECFEVGLPFNFSQTMEIVIEGKIRYENKIPPGYMDADPAKIGFAQYGDLIIWKQILVKAKADNRNIVFVTKDTKQDWCYRKDNKADKIERPREELIMEFYEKTNNNFWMYTIQDFLFVAGIYGNKVSEDTINEAENSISYESISDIELSVFNWLKDNYPLSTIISNYDNINICDFTVINDDKKIGIEIRRLKLTQYQLEYIIKKGEKFLEKNQINEYKILFIIDTIDDINYLNTLKVLCSKIIINLNISFSFGIIDHLNKNFVEI